MDGLTRQQADCKAFVAAYTREKGGVSPSYTEIMLALGLRSKSGVHRLVTALLERGHLARSGDHRFAKARALRVVERSCPHCGGALDAPPLLPAPAPTRPGPGPNRVTHLRPREARMETR